MRFYADVVQNKYDISIGGQSSMNIDLAINPPFEGVDFDLPSVEVWSYPEADCRRPRPSTSAMKEAKR